MQHNVYLEWSINGKAYFQAFRALCRMRISFAKAVIESWEVTYDSRSAELRRRILFWTNVYQYWEKKLKESFTKEKEYFGE